ncbi:MAG: CBS domain-containing protein [Bdellovibrionales bacterium]|nr:CBS domain-containing protein [Bdellovibrionales bacterium]
MSTDVFSVDQDRGFNQVELIADLKHVRHVPVVDEDEGVIGMVSVRDLLAHLSNAAASQFVPIKEVMSRNVVTLSPETSVADVAKCMIDKSIGAIPIVENEKLVGIISERDFVKLAAK